MKKSLVLALTFFLCLAGIGQPILTGEFNRQSSEIALEWNMMSHSSRTAYTILKSRDGVNWTELIRDRMVRNYTDEDAYTYGDKSFTNGKNFYRVKIVDARGNIIALSNIVSVNTQEAAGISKSSWVIYPNPVTDVLNIAYKGSKQLQGCYNLTVTDATGKIVIRYRCASIYKTFQVPVNKLQRGTHHLQITVNGEVVVNEKFVKQ